MYRIDDMIVYARMGICQIKDIEKKAFSVKSSSESTCYVLKPIYDKTSTVFVPVDNEKLTGMMRNVMTKEEIDGLLENIKGKEDEWIENQHERNIKFREILSNGVRQDMLMMIRCIQAKKKDLDDKGKKLGSSDETTLKEAKREVNQEFAYALDIDQDGVGDYITSRIN